MAGLADRYRAARPPDNDGRGAAVNDRGLEPALAALCARGRAAHPDLPLGDAAFVAHLGRVGAAVETGPDGVHAEDLFLACAALSGNAAAVERIQSRHRAAIGGYLRAIKDDARAQLEDIEQRVWEVLLSGRGGAAAKLATYSGRGALASFVGIVAQRIALDGRRHHAAEARAVAGMGAEVRAVAADAEMALIKGRYRDGFRQALRDALGTLADRERMILRMHLVDGLTFESIAKVYRVTQPTVSRWFAKARGNVLDETRRLLRERLSLSPADFDSLAGLLMSQLDVSMSQILGGSPNAA